MIGLIIALFAANASAAATMSWPHVQAEVNFGEDALDAFGRLQVVEPRPVAILSFAYGLLPKVATVTYSGSGSSSTAAGIFSLNTGASANSSATMRSKRASRYVPGQGMAAIFTSIFSPCVAGSSQTIGIQSIGGNDGWAVGCNGAEFGILRSSGGYHTWVSSGNWNGVPFKGDITKGQVWMIQYQWLGFGEQRFFYEDRTTGRFVLAHRIQYADRYTQTAVFNPSLFLRMFVYNKTNTTNITLQSPSMGSFRMGPNGVYGQHASTSSLKSGVTTAPIMTICSTTTYNGQDSRLGINVKILSVANESTNRPVRIRLVKDGTLTGAVFARADSTSFVDVDTTASAVAGGSEIFTMWLAKSSAETVDISETVGIILNPGECITAEGSTSAGSADIGAALHWDEIN